MLFEPRKALLSLCAWASFDRCHASATVPRRALGGDTAGPAVINESSTVAGKDFIGFLLNAALRNHSFCSRVSYGNCGMKVSPKQTDSVRVNPGPRA